MTDHESPNVKNSPTFVTPDVMGEVWPEAAPAEDAVTYGHVDMAPKGSFEARSLQTFTLTYTVGRYGLDDTGGIRIVFRYMGDWGEFQTKDPSGANYVTAHSSNGTPLHVVYDPYGHNRPRFKALTVRVHGGYLSEGDTINVVFGDTSFGSPGMQLQTFCESSFEFKVLVDPCAVGHFVPIPNSPTISVIPGLPKTWRVVMPTLRRPNEPFRLGIKAEDKWGNPSDLAEESLKIEASIPVNGLPDKLDFQKGTRTYVFDDLSCTNEGILSVKIYNSDGDLIAKSNPLYVKQSDFGGYWGDMHGQSGESVGINTSRQYFDFARNHAVLDATSHQANDFHINKRFWQHINDLSAEYYEEGKFVTFPGYEWSGNTAVGGDRNVYFREEGRQIRRSSHALIPDQSDIDTDAPDAKILFEALKDEDVVVCAHVGGRYADTSFAHDPKLETAMEVHSAWGTFEWLLTDGFELGHRCGVVCNSDGHKGRPGASYPGAARFGAYGGLTCFLSKDLSRDGFMEALRRRHHYGTTGARVHMDVRIDFPEESTLFHRNPKAFDAPKTEKVTAAMMGDIVQTAARKVSMKCEVASENGIERVEVRNGKEVLKTMRPYAKSDLGERIRIIWSGAEYRGRGRQSSWRGKVQLDGASIVQMRKINAWNHERQLEQTSDHTVLFNTITTGNYGGIDLWISPSSTANPTLTLTSNHGAVTYDLSDKKLEDVELDAGGLERKIKIYRLPNQIDTAPFTFEQEIDLKPKGDNPLWICAYTEDGFQAWSSPLFIYNEED